MFELQIKKYESDLHSYEHYLSISEKKAWEKKNSGLYAGFEPMTFVIPVQCFTNWANKPTTDCSSYLNFFKVHG